MSTDSYFSYKVFVIYSGKTLAFTTAFFTALPTMIAITIFAASPGRYGMHLGADKMNKVVLYVAGVNGFE